jgi:hypothetical protein
MAYQTPDSTAPGSFQNKLMINEIIHYYVGKLPPLATGGNASKPAPHGQTLLAL